MLIITTSLELLPEQEHFRLLIILTAWSFGMAGSEDKLKIIFGNSKLPFFFRPLPRLFGVV